MSEKQFMNVLQRALEDKVTVTIRTNSNDYFMGYISDIGDDYLKMIRSFKKNGQENFVKLEFIESISTKWDE